MEPSKNFEKVAQYYHLGVWSEQMVRNAVAKGWITAEEYTEITKKELSKE